MPADLLSLLSRSAGSLAAQQAASSTASNNLQNANTPGYARQRAELEAVLPAEFTGKGFLGRGVDLQTVSQARDKFLEAQIPTAMGSQARSTAQSDSLQALSALDPAAPGGLSSSLSDFYSAMRALSQNAGDANLRAAAVGASQRLALSFNRTAKTIESARSGLDAAVPGVLAQANDAAATVARLNGQIRIERSTGHEPNDLLDARQNAIDTLARLVGAAPVPNGSGDVTMSLPGGAALVSGENAGKLSTAGDPANGGHLAITFTAADGSGPSKLAAGAVGGKAGGLLDARDGALLTAAQKVDTLAFDLGNQLNTVHAAGFALDGTTGRNLFTVAATAAGAASSIAVDPDVRADPSLLAAAATAAGAPGDAANMLALVATERAALSGGQDAGSTLSSIISDYGATTASAKAFSEQDGAILDDLTTMRESVSGVSIDEEMINLTKAQRAFEATMKVVTTADSMLSTLLAIPIT